MKYTGMGTMESGIHNVLAGRMKHNGTSWSKNGAENMAKLLALKHEGRLEEVLKNLYKDIEEISIKESISEMLKQKYNEAESAIKEALKGSKKKPKIYKCKKTHI
ncbi:MAG: hypothetical protein ACREV6_21485 [Clostridium sp.]|uniref:hypothetical protein n=1 Tax=Clostridium sp. TaxID=1506 RepID=UPI003D6D3BCD